MSTKNEAQIAYGNLRARLRALQGVRGRLTLQELFQVFDQTWRSLLAARRHLSAAYERKYGDLELIDGGDLYAMAAGIYQGDDGDPHCEGCGAAVEKGDKDCPFCGANFTGSEYSVSVPASAYGAKKVRSKRPDWDIDYGAEEILAKGKREEIGSLDDQDGVELMKPTDSKSRIPGPTGERRPRTNRRGITAKDARELMRWVRRREVCKGFPYDFESLKDLRRGTLLVIAAACGMEPDEYFRDPSSAIRSKILARQPKAPADPGEPPVPIDAEILAIAERMEGDDG